jgi:pyrimidine operon attenuation protein / uracil phosphoribosyltransferase
MPRPDNEVVIQEQDQMERTLTRIAHEILEKNDSDTKLAVVGIHTRGAYLGRRLHALLTQFSDREVHLGEIDITLYRDDLSARGETGVIAMSPYPIVKGTNLPFELEGTTVVLVDDVLYTGRTVRAAIDALLHHGRPARIQFAVLVDRGHRELPIRADYVGKNVPTAQRERISVRLQESDGVEEVALVRGQPAE